MLVEYVGVGACKIKEIPQAALHGYGILYGVGEKLLQVEITSSFFQLLNHQVNAVGVDPEIEEIEEHLFKRGHVGLHVVLFNFQITKVEIGLSLLEFVGHVLEDIFLRLAGCNGGKLRGQLVEQAVAAKREFEGDVGFGNKDLRDNRGGMLAKLWNSRPATANTPRLILTSQPRFERRLNCLLISWRVLLQKLVDFRGMGNIAKVGDKDQGLVQVRESPCVPFFEVVRGPGRSCVVSPYSEAPPMVLVPAAFEAQYIALSTMTFLSFFLQVTRMEALPDIPECSAML